jgi:hypothetical protein
MKSNIKQHLQKAGKIHISCDVWTKKGMTQSFLGVTAHFVSLMELRCVTLAVREMPCPHTGERIKEVLEKILIEWEIQPFQLGKVVTDNGSNMIKAFRSVVNLGSSTQETDDSRNITLQIILNYTDQLNMFVMMNYTTMLIQKLKYMILKTKNLITN